MPRSIVMAVDGLRACWLGPYGNTWFDTPVFNELAAQSRLHQHCLADSASISQNYDSFWRGQRFDRRAEAPFPRSLPSFCVTDSADVLDLADAAAFDQIIESPEPTPGELAADEASTSSALAIAAAIQTLSALPPSQDYHCWIHLEFLSGSWDAPLTLRENLALQEDAAPSTWLRPPTSGGDESAVDPDVRFDWLLAAAAQVQALDLVLMTLLDFAAASGALLVVTGVRGCPLGEHGSVGWEQPKLHTELLQIPLMARFPDGRDACHRCYPLVQCAEVHDLVLDWHQGAKGGLTSAEQLVPMPQRELAVSRAPGQLGIRTAAWYARVSETTELYCKPDDQFELNEVANRCSAEVAAMCELAERLQRPEPYRDWTLPEVLWNPAR